jgi:Flp pilus assembly protein TadD
LAVEVCEVWKDSKECNLDVTFDDALKIRRNDAGVHLVKGVYLQKRKRTTEAIDSYKKSIAINPNSANAHYNLALAYVAQKQNALANEHAQQAYALGMMLPGLQNRLIAENAWKPIEPKPVTEPTVPAEASPTVSDEATPKPLKSETNSNDGSK